MREIEKQNIANKAFSFLELSILIVIISILATQSLVISNRITNYKNIANTEQKIATITNKLSDYYRENGVYPCPANLATDVYDANFGIALDANNSCAEVADSMIIFPTSNPQNYYGGVPTATLGLSNDYAFDNWGRKLSYVITKDSRISYLDTASIASHLSPATESRIKCWSDLSDADKLILGGKTGYENIESIIDKSGNDCNMSQTDIALPNPPYLKGSILNNKSIYANFAGNNSMEVSQLSGDLSDSSGYTTIMVLGAIADISYEDDNYFNPSSISNMVLWLDAADDNTTFHDQNLVSSWQDKSGQGNDATQNIANHKPELTYDVISGNNALYFDGGNYMDVDLTSIAGGSYSVFVVEARTSSTSGFFLGTSNNSTNDGLHIGYRSNTVFSFAQYFNDLDSIIDPYYIGGKDTRISTNILDTSEGHFTYFDGVLKDCNKNTSPLISATNGNIGKGFNPTYYTGYVAEIIVYNKALNSAEQTKVESYLRNKWGNVPFSGLNLWLDAYNYSTITQSEGKVALWKDKSGHNNHAQQLDPDLQPIYNATGLNSLPSIDISSDRMDIINNAIIDKPYNDITIFAVAELESQNLLQKQTIIRFGDSGNDPFTGIYEDKIQFDQTNANITIDSPSLLQINQPSLIGYQIERTPVKYNIELRHNSQAVNTQSITNNTDPADANTIYLFDKLLGGEALDGKISELLLYDRLLTSNEIDRIERYLTDKWLTVPKLGLALWLDADDESTIDHNLGLVSQWRDKSGNNINFSQITDNNKPSYISSGIRKRGTLSFAGDDWLGGGDVLDIGTNEGWNIYVVGQRNNTNTMAYFSKSIYDSANNKYSLFGSTNMKMYSRDDSDNSADFVSSNIGSPELVALRLYRKIGETGTAKAYENGVLKQTIATGVNDASYNFDSNFYTFIGAYNDANGQANPTIHFLDGNIAEILIYDRILTEQEHEHIQRYLLNKWINNPAPEGSPILTTSLSNTSPGEAFYTNSQGNKKLYYSDYDGRGNIQISGDDIFLNRDLNILSIIRDPNNVTTRINNVDQGSTYIGSVKNSDKVNIATSDLFGKYSIFNLYEFLFFDKVLTTAEIDSLERTLLAKWDPENAPQDKFIIKSRDDETISESAKAVIISHGQNGYGAYNASGNKLPISQIGSKEQYNIIDPSRGMTFYSHSASEKYDDKEDNLFHRDLDDIVRYIDIQRFEKEFSPEDAGEILLWLDADDESTIIHNQDLISIWEDKSGNDYHAVQQNGINKPKYYDNRVNNRGIVSFEGDDYLKYNGFGTDIISQPNSIFIVAKRNNDGDFIDGVAIGKRQNISISSDQYEIASNLNIITSSISDNGNYNIINVIFDADNTKLYINGLEDGSITQSSLMLNDNLTGYILGGDYQSNPTFTGEIAEIIIYNNLLSDESRKDVENYLSDKWLAGNFIPTNIGGLVSWLDASDSSTITSNGGVDVSFWGDKSGILNNAVQSITSKMPIITQNAISGRQALYFDGNDNMDINLTYLANSSYTIFVVENRTSQNAKLFLGTQNAVVNDGLHIGYRSNNVFTYAQYFNDIDSTVNSHNNAVENTRLSTSIKDTSSGQYTYLDGILTNSSTNTTSLLTGTDGTIGRGYDESYYIGYIGEIIIYNRALSESERLEVELYLQQKWGL